MIAWLLVTASAADAPNTLLTAQLEVVYALHQEHPVGMRLGIDWKVALGDACDHAEPDPCRGSGLWPIAAPAFSVTWRGRNRFAFELDGEIGTGWLDMHHVGFLPVWEVAGRTGLRFAIGKRPAVILGGWGSKSFGLVLTEADGLQHHYGANALGVRFGADTAYVIGEVWEAPTLAGGLWIFASRVGTYE